MEVCAHTRISCEFSPKCQIRCGNTWEVRSTTFAGYYYYYYYYYYQVKIVVNGCGFKAALSKSKKTYNGLQPDTNSHVVNKTRTLLLPADFVPISPAAYYVMNKQNMPPKGAVKAYRRSQSLIFNSEAPQFVGAGEGTDNLDFMADLSTLEVIDPDTKESQESPQSEEGPIPAVWTPLLNLLIGKHIPYAHCAWCTESSQTLSQLGSHYLSEHRVVLQPSCCSPPSVFQTIMGMELQLRQSNIRFILHWTCEVEMGHGL